MNSSEVSAHRSLITALCEAGVSGKWGHGTVTKGLAPRMALASRYLKGSPTTFITSRLAPQTPQALAALSLSQRN